MKSEKTKIRLLVIDDDRVFGDAIRDYLTSDSVEVLIADKTADNDQNNLIFSTAFPSDKTAIKPIQLGARDQAPLLST